MCQKLKATVAAIALAAGTFSFAAVAEAAFIFNGSFGQANDVQLFSFTVAAPTNVTMETFNFHAGAAGGPFNGVTSTGGFDTMLSLFNFSGAFITAVQPDIDVFAQNYDARIG